MTLTRTSPEGPVSLKRSTIANAPRRARKDRLLTLVLGAGMVLAVIPLVLIVFEVTRRGMGTLSWEFLSSVERSFRREEGGYYHGIVGTVQMVGTATCIAVPLGIGAAVYLVEYGRGWLARLVRFFTDVMTGVPSVFVGLFIYAALVRIYGFGALMGALALAVIMLPIVVRTAEEILKLVPADLRRASLALGARRWQTTLKVVLPAAGPGLITGSMLAVARAAGETAPLLLTAFGSLTLTYRLQGVGQTSLPQLIYQGARQPFAPGIERAWAGALTLLAIVFLLTVVARWIGSRRQV